MPLQNIVGLVLPLGVAIAIGALVLGLFYRERTDDYNYQESLGGSDFDPCAGYDTSSRRSRKKDEEEEKCIICIEPMRRFQGIRTLPCAHQFHKRCINGWLRYEQFCPLCKTAVVGN